MPNRTIKGKGRAWPDAIPEELRALNRWVVWRAVPDADPAKKPKKVPIDPATGMPASSTDPTTWRSFDVAVRALREGVTGADAPPNACDRPKGNAFDGLMFALRPDNGYVFIDLDGCRNVNNKTINVQGQAILRRLNSYCEISPSGTGVHIIVKAKKPGDRCRQGGVEIYDHARFAAMTGRVLSAFGTGRIEARQEELEQVYNQYVAISQTDQDRAVPAVPVPEQKLAELLQNPAAAAIYRGEAAGQYASQSEADWRLCKLAIEKGWNDAELTALLQAARENAGADPKYAGYYALTIKKARGVAPVDMATAREAFQRHLHLPDLMILDVILGVVAASAMPGDPCWVHIVGPPSTGKTELINAVRNWPLVYPLTELTPAGLVSGRNSDDGQDHSLLPHLHCKTLAIKDFTPILELPKDQRQKLVSRLRDAFDGSQAIHSALVGTRSHRGTFNCITGVTNAIEKLWRNTSLGERYLLYRHEAPDSIMSATKALGEANQKKQVRDELARAACGVLAGVDQDCVPDCPQTIQKRIVHLAAVLARARTYVERNREHEVTLPPEPEGPSRIAQQLLKLGQGLALINRRREVAEADLPILARVVLDSMPLVRRRLLDVLRSVAADQRASTGQLIIGVRLSQPAVNQQMVDLWMLNICAGRAASGIGGEMSYALTPEFRKLLDAAGLGTAGTAGTDGTAR